MMARPAWHAFTQSWFRAHNFRSLGSWCGQIQYRSRRRTSALRLARRRHWSGPVFLLNVASLTGRAWEARLMPLCDADELPIALACQTETMPATTSSGVAGSPPAEFLG